MTIRRIDERLYEFATQLESYSETITVATTGNEQLVAQLRQYAADARVLGRRDATTEDDVRALRDRFAATAASVSDRDTARTLETIALSLNPFRMDLTDTA